MKLIRNHKFISTFLHLTYFSAGCGSGLATYQPIDHSNVINKSSNLPEHKSNIDFDKQPSDIITQSQQPLNTPSNLTYLSPPHPPQNFPPQNLSDISPFQLISERPETVPPVQVNQA